MTHSQEARGQISGSSKLRWADPEYQKRQSESRRRAWARRKAEFALKAGVKTLECENCGSQFAPLVVRHGSNAQKYCSEKCRDTAYMRRKRKKPEYAAKIRERWTDDPKFRESRLAAARRWRERHPEKAKAATLKWVSKNLEHLAEYQSARRKKNPEKSRRQQRDYYHRLRDAARAALAAKPNKKCGGSAAGKLLGDSPQRIRDIARYKLQGKSDRWIQRHWREVTGTFASEAAAKSFIIRHKSRIAQKCVELSQTAGGA